LKLTSASISPGLVTFAKSLSVNVARRAVAIGRQRQLVGDELAVGGGRFAVVVFLVVAVLPLGLAQVARRLEGELVVAGEARAAALQQCRGAQRGAAHGSAREIVHLHADGNALRRDRGALGAADAGVDQRQAEFLDAEIAT
jgi:hypothetical protein